MSIAPPPSPDPNAHRRSKPWDERFSDAAVTGFALWTLCCHAVVFSGGSLRSLVALFAITLATLTAGRWWLRRRRPGVPERRQPVEDFDLPAMLRWSLATVGLVAALTLSRPATFIGLWAVVAAVLGVAAGWLFFRPGTLQKAAVAPRDHRRDAYVLLLALGVAVLALLLHKSNADDAFYVSLAVHAVEAPSSPLLAGDPMHGIDDLPLYISIYRIHSWEMFCAAVSYLTGLPAITVFHLLATGLAAFKLHGHHMRPSLKLSICCYPDCSHQLQLQAVLGHNLHDHN